MIGWLVGAVAVHEIGNVVGSIGNGNAWEVSIDGQGRYWLTDNRSGRISQHRDEKSAVKAARKIR